MTDTQTDAPRVPTSRLSTPRAVLLAGALIAAALVLPLLLPKYQIVGNSDSGAAVTRLNVRTGAVVLCVPHTDVRPAGENAVVTYHCDGQLP